MIGYGYPRVGEVGLIVGRQGRALVGLGGSVLGVLDWIGAAVRRRYDIAVTAVATAGSVIPALPVVLAHNAADAHCVQHTNTHTENNNARYKLFVMLFLCYVYIGKYVSSLSSFFFRARALEECASATTPQT